MGKKRRIANKKKWTGGGNNGNLFVIGVFLMVFLAAYNLSGGTRDFTSAPVNPQPVQILASTPENAKNELQLYDLEFITLTPSPATQPIQQLSPTVGTSGGIVKDKIDFSDPTLDWDDLGGLFSLQGVGLSSTCTSELNKATLNEDGESFPSQKDSTSSHAPPGSRVWFCWRDPSCKARGFDYYQGTTPLPVSIPSLACQTEMAGRWDDLVKRGKIAIFKGSSFTSMQADDLDGTFPHGCDKSDQICN